MGIRHDLKQLVPMIQERTTIRPINFFEMGSRDGHDTHAISNAWKISPANCFIFEAHPELANIIQQTYPYHVFNIALGNETKPISFYAGDLEKEGNVGVSSVLPQVSNEFIFNLVEVDMWRFDEICDNVNITNDMLDLFKIDVEGFSYEVLLGFGERLNYAKAIQLEIETFQHWQGQKVFDDVNYLMDQFGFVLLDRPYCGDVVESKQLDCLFVQKNFIK